MKLLKNHAYLQGFEDYNIVCINGICFTSTYGFYVPYDFDNSPGAYIVNRDLPARPYYIDNIVYSWLSELRFEPELVTNHKELLDTAKKVFTHSTCKLSRSMIAEKYKKSLNPYLSDAVIIPKPDYSGFNLSKKALFMNEQARIIVVVRIDGEDAHNHIKDTEVGARFGNLTTSNPDFGTRHKAYSINDVLDAELFYYGEVLYIPNCHSWAMDVLTHNLPVDKIVFEESVQESLSSETNQLDFDSLCSIKDMLDSPDENTVFAGLKSLSMMDWMHYPNSIKFMMDQTTIYNWRYNKACSSTSVKYMLKNITGTTNRRCWPGSMHEEIYEEDFELFKKLKCYYHHIQPDNILSYIRSLNFMRVNSEGMIVPNIKQRS